MPRNNPTARCFYWAALDVVAVVVVVAVVAVVAVDGRGISK